MQIGDLAKHFDLNPKTIRYYEEIGLLPDPARTESGYRQYDGQAVSRLGFIQRAKLLGLSLENESAKKSGVSHQGRRYLAWGAGRLSFGAFARCFCGNRSLSARVYL